MFQYSLSCKHCKRARLNFHYKIIRNSPVIANVFIASIAATLSVPQIHVTVFMIHIREATSVPPPHVASLTQINAAQITASCSNKTEP
jgi:hypothetical protein